MAGSSDTQKNRELTWLIAAVLFLTLLAFVGGYFIGVRHGARAFMCAQQEELVENVIDDAVAPESGVALASVMPSSTLTSESGVLSIPLQQPSIAAVTSYWAVGAMVDSYVMATHLMEQAATVGVVVRIKKVTNLLPHSRKKIVYQLVTPRYTTQEQLESALARLKKLPSWSKYINATINKD